MTVVVPVVFFSVLGGIFIFLLLCWYICIFRTTREAANRSVRHLRLLSDPTASDRHHDEPCCASPVGNTNDNISANKQSSSLLGDDLAIGIDIGTENTRFAVVEEGRVRVLQNENGQLLTRTLIAAPGYDLPNSPRLVFGSVAQAACENDPNTNVADNLCRNITNPNARVNWRLFDDPDDDSVSLSPTTLMALMLSFIRQSAEKAVDETIEFAVVAIPTSMNDQQRQAYRDAAKIAGFKKIRLHPKPSLGLLYYLLNSYNPEEIYAFGGYVVAFRFGAGTMEAALMELKRGVVNVVASAGSQKLGGADLTEAFYEACLEKLKQKKGGRKAISDQLAMHYLRQDCEKKKIILAAANQVHFFVDVGKKTIKFTFEKEDFERLLLPYESEIRRLLDHILEEGKRKSHVSRNQIGHVYLFGGSSRFPKIQQLVKDYFESSSYIHVSPLDDHAVVQGAAIQAAFITGRPVSGMLTTEIREVAGYGIEPSIDGVLLGKAIDSHDHISLMKPLDKLSLPIQGELSLIQTFDCNNEKYEIKLLHWKKSEAFLETKKSLSLLVDENGIVHIVVDSNPPKIFMHKRYEMPKRVFSDKEHLLERIAAEAARRRKEPRRRSVIERLVSSLAIPADEDETALVDEDFLA